MCVCGGGGGGGGGVPLLQISHKYMYVHLRSSSLSSAIYKWASYNDGISPIYYHAHGSQGIAATSFHYSKPHLSDLPKKYSGSPFASLLPT